MSKTESLSNNNASLNTNKEESNRPDEAAGVPMEGDPPHFHRGETENCELADTWLAAQHQTFPPGPSGLQAQIASPSLFPNDWGEIGTPTEEAALLGELLRTRRRFDIEIFARIYAVTELYWHDLGARNAFIVELGQQDVLTTVDVRQALSDKSKLSKWRKIGGHASVLLRLNLSLGEGWTVLYAVVVLFEMLLGDWDDKVHALTTLQAAHDGKLTRSVLEKETRRLKKPNSDGKGKPHKIRLLDDGSGRESSTGMPPADLVLITVGEDEWPKFASVFSENRPKERLNLGRFATEAVVVVVTSFRDFALYWTKLFREWGLHEIEAALITNLAGNVDITHAEIVVFASNSSLCALPIKFDEKEWLQDIQGGDLRTLMDKMIPDAKRKRHLFARDAVDGWDCVMGDQNWQ